MKCFLSVIVLSCAVLAVSSEPPRFRSSRRFQFQRQELAPSTPEPEKEPTTQAGDAAPYPPAGGPYPPSGWKPAGQAFTLPSRQEAAPPSDSYGAPAEAQQGPYPPSGWKPAGQAFTLPARQEVPAQPMDSYGAPANSYGPPDTEYGAPSTDAPSTETPTTTVNPAASQRLQAGAWNANPSDQDVTVQRSEGVYYIVLPNSQLQKVDVSTSSDPRTMAFSAQLRVRDQDRLPVFLVAPRFFAPAPFA